jgi:hypothetical protein
MMHSLFTAQALSASRPTLSKYRQAIARGCASMSTHFARRSCLFPPQLPAVWRRNGGRGPITSSPCRYQKNNFPSLSDQTLPKQPSPEITSGVPGIAVCARACQRVVPSEGAGVVPFHEGTPLGAKRANEEKARRVCGGYVCMHDAEGGCLSLTLN